MASHAIADVAIVLNPGDDVAIAKKEIAAGTVLEDAGRHIEVRQDIRPGHKVARHARRTETTSPSSRPSTARPA